MSFWGGGCFLLPANTPPAVLEDVVTAQHCFSTGLEASCLRNMITLLLLFASRSFLAAHPIAPLVLSGSATSVASHPAYKCTVFVFKGMFFGSALAPGLVFGFSTEPGELLFDFGEKSLKTTSLSVWQMHHHEGARGRVFRKLQPCWSRALVWGRICEHLLAHS